MSPNASNTHAPSAEDLTSNLSWMRGLALELVGDPHQADDLTQEALVIALARGRWERSWLAGVLRNLRWHRSRAEDRRRYHERTAARPEEVAPVTEPLERAAVLRDVTDALLALDEPYRGTLLLRYVDGLPQRRIAARLGIPLPTVNSRLTRGLAKLREELDTRRAADGPWAPALLALGTGELTQRGVPLGVWIMTLKGKLVATAAVVALTWVGWQATRERQSIDAVQPEPSAAVVASTAVAESEREQTEATGTRGRTAAPAARATAPTATLTVRVVRGAYPSLGLVEEPAAGVQLTIAPGGRRAFGPPGPDTVQGTTDEQGRFTTELTTRGQPPFDVTIVAAPTPGYRPQERAVQLAGDTPSGSEVLVVLPALGQVPGRVVDHVGTPLGGVRITATASAGRAAPEQVATTDADGHFRATLTTRSSLDASAAGWVLVDSPRLEFEESGGWKPVELVMVPAGSLVVRARDAEQKPVAGLELQVKLAEVELPATRGFRMRPRHRLAAVSDPAGLAELAGCWIERKLVLTLTDHGQTFRFDGHKDGELTPSGTAGSLPLVIPPAGRLELDLVREPPLRVRGVVRLPDGSAPAKGRVTLRDLGRGQLHALPTSSAGASCDANGAFEALLSQRGLVGPIAVTAYDSTPGTGLSRTPGIGLHGTRVEVGPDAAVEGVLEVELVLEPTYSIAGTLLEENGSPLAVEGFGNRVYAVPAGSSSRFSPTALGLEAQATSKDGTFRISGLPAGQYDLWGTRELNNFFSHSTVIHRFAGIPAGTEGVELRLPRAGAVRIRVRLDPEGAPVERAIVLLANLQPWVERTPPGASPARLEARAPAHWPRTAPIDFTGASGGSADGGRYQHGLYGVAQLDGHELPPLGPGWYRLGVNASGYGDSAPLPVATELVYLHPGEYELYVRLTATAHVRGRLLATGSTAHLAVALATEDGDALPLPDRSVRHLATITPVTAAGEFELRAVPVGRHRLRIGTPDQLERGELLQERWIEVAPGSNTALEIQL